MNLVYLKYVPIGAGSSAGEHRPYKPGVAGSKPAPPTITASPANIFLVFSILNLEFTYMGA